LTVSVGTTVTWVNNDTSTHTSTSNSAAFDTGSIAPGGSASFRFQSAGSFPYHCTFHPGMVATINVQ
jgi:plastocyanin